MHKQSKYHNKTVTAYGIKFDSKKEVVRYRELSLLERAKAIKDLKLQVKFELIPKQKDERACYYIADFTYYEKDQNGEWRFVVEDCKGVRTDVYRIKRKLMLYVHNIKIRET